MLQKLQQLADRLKQEYPLTTEDTAYLEQINDISDIGNFEDDGSGALLSLALDAAKTLGVNETECDELETAWLLREAERRAGFSIGDVVRVDTDSIEGQPWNEFVGTIVRIDNEKLILQDDLPRWRCSPLAVVEPAWCRVFESAPISAPTSTTHDFSHTGLGIGGINNDQSLPEIPSVAAIERVQQMMDTDVVCRRCGASKNFDGAMFTTGGGDICDDCF